MEYFKESVQRDGDSLNAFCEALKSGNSHGVEKQFGYICTKENERKLLSWDSVRPAGI